MKLLQLADVHIGTSTWGKLDSATGMNTRLLELRRSLDWVATVAREQEVDAIAFCGDMGESRNMTGPELEAALYLRRALSIPIVGILGNHDLEWHPRRSAVMTVAGSLVAAPKVHELVGLGLRVVCIPYPSRAVIASAGVNVGDAMAEVVASLLAQSKPLDHTVVLAHMSVAGATFNPKQNPLLMTAQDVMVPVTALKQNGVDAVLLGHLHQAQDVLGDVTVHYSGSLMTLTFGEENDPAKGVTIWDLDAGSKVRVENPHSPLFRTHDVDEVDDPDAIVAAAMQQSAGRQVYLRVKSDTKLPDSYKARLARLCEENGVKLCAIVEKQERSVRVGSVDVAKAATDADVVHEYSKVNGFAPEMAKQLVAVMEEVDADDC